MNDQHVVTNCDKFHTLSLREQTEGVNGELVS